jgi:hypothetical protein
MGWEPGSWKRTQRTAPFMLLCSNIPDWGESASLGSRNGDLGLPTYTLMVMLITPAAPYNRGVWG